MRRILPPMNELFEKLTNTTQVNEYLTLEPGTWSIMIQNADAILQCIKLPLDSAKQNKIFIYLM